MRHIGFTGTRDGMTDRQLKAVRDILQKMKAEGFTHFHHGDCIGADAEAHSIAKEFGFTVVVHPPLSDWKRAFCKSDEAREAKDYLPRDADIVEETEFIIATPKTAQEEARSGTWYTVRYAAKKGKPHLVVNP